MADYIKREDAEKALLDQCYCTGYGGLTKIDIQYVMEKIPSADVVPVVRCKDCKHSSFVDRFCYKNSIFVCSGDWFCADGKRRDGGT